MKYSDSLSQLYYEDNKIAVLFSGGMGSFLSAYLLKVQGYKNVTLYFNDTLTEDDDLYRFLIEAHQWLGYPLVYDIDGRSVFQVFIDNAYMGNTRVDVCSRVLKRERRQRWAATERPNYLALGIDPWEQDRLDRANHYRERSITELVDCIYKAPGLSVQLLRWLTPWLWLCQVAKWENPSSERVSEVISQNPRFISPLIDAGCFDMRQLKTEALTVSGIEEPALYKMGFAHNNCGGFCVKAGLAHYKQLWEQDKDRYLRFESQESQVYEAVPNAKPFLRKTINGKLRYMTLQDYRINYLEPADRLPVQQSLFIFDELDMSPTSCKACAIQ